MLIWAILFVGLAVYAEEAARPAIILSLEEAIERALSVSPEIGEARFDIEMAKSKLNEVKAYQYPQIETIALIGPVPNARGDQVFSSDEKDEINGLGAFEKLDMTFTQPLYTFGKISNGLRAATHRINVQEARANQKSSEIILKVKEFYFGLLLARELKGLILEAKEAIETAQGKVRDLLEKGSDAVDEIDLLKLQTFSGEVERLFQEATKSERLAHSALRTRIGLAEEAEFDIDVHHLPYESREIDPFDSYVAKARRQRPEFVQIREGLQAREALIRVAEGEYYPDFFLGGTLSVADAGGRTEIDNPFIFDPFNHAYGGIAVGLKWKTDFGITKAKVTAARAEFNKLTRTKDFAEAFIPLQIKKAFLEVKEAQESIRATEASSLSARKWLVSAVANFDFGIGPAKEIFEALEAYARMKANYFRSVYNYNIAVANLDQATGDDQLKITRR